jgi:N-acetylglucosamine kinase-like BadF-type ATPase
MEPWLLVEGGGTKTWVCITGQEPVMVTGGSTHPGSVGDNEAKRTLRELFHQAIARIPHAKPNIELVVTAHGAATTPESATDFAAILSSSLTDLGVRAPVVLTGDILPILLVAGQELSLAAIVGTGSEYAGTYKFEKFSHAGGMDYVLSDEGGGYDIGLQGLRAVIRSLDGRSAPTRLNIMASQWVGEASSRDLAFALFNKVNLSHVRPIVASFAPFVISCAREGDDVALSILRAAAREIVTGLLAVRAALRETGKSEAVALSGSLITTDNIFKDIALSQIRAQFPSVSISFAGADRFVEQMTSLGRFIIEHRGDLDTLRAAGPIVFLDEPML